MKNTYWNNRGKYQEELDRLNELMPNYGYTNNEYMNLLITISHIYYRKYNDGDSIFEFEDRVNNYIIPFAEELNFEAFKDYESQELEELVNKTIELIKDKDLSYQEL